MRLANPQDNTDIVNLQYLLRILQDYYEKKLILMEDSTKSQIRVNFKTIFKRIMILIWEITLKLLI